MTNRRGERLSDIRLMSRAVRAAGAVNPLVDKGNDFDCCVRIQLSQRRQSDSEYNKPFGIEISDGADALEDKGRAQWICLYSSIGERAQGIQPSFTEQFFCTVELFGEGSLLPPKRLFLKFLSTHRQ